LAFGCFDDTSSSADALKDKIADISDFLVSPVHCKSTPQQIYRPGPELGFQRFPQLTKMAVKTL
jgi:hypothetical protein